MKRCGKSTRLPPIWPGFDSVLDAIALRRSQAKAPDAGGSVGQVVRALAFHRCGPGSFSASGVICGLSLLLLFSVVRGFSPCTPVFASHGKPTFDLICE